MKFFSVAYKPDFIGAALTACWNQLHWTERSQIGTITIYSAWNPCSFEVLEALQCESTRPASSALSPADTKNNWENSDLPRGIWLWNQIVNNDVYSKISILPVRARVSPNMFIPLSIIPQFSAPSLGFVPKYQQRFLRLGKAKAQKTSEETILKACLLLR